MYGWVIPVEINTVNTIQNIQEIVEIIGVLVGKIWVNMISQQALII